MADLLDKFWSRVEIGKEGECWIWKGRVENGYPKFYSSHKDWYSANFLYRFLNGDITKETGVYHSCNNVLCVNPSHLFSDKLGKFKAGLLSGREKFWSRVNIRGEHECWEWTGTKDHNGYGVLTCDSKHFYAHRFSYEDRVGKIPDGLVIRHKCDNPICVNPNHLLVGTIADNTNDARERGRFWYQRVVPVKQIRPRRVRKLAKSDVLEIINERRTGAKLKDLAEKWSIHESLISKIMRGINHKDVSLNQPDIIEKSKQRKPHAETIESFS